MSNPIPNSDRSGPATRKRLSGGSSASPATEPPEILLARDLGRLIGKHLAETWQIQSPPTHDQAGETRPPQDEV